MKITKKQLCARTLPFLFLLTPFIANAYAISDFTTLKSALTSIFNDVIAVLFGLVLVLFLYNMAQYVLKSSEAKGREEARQYAIAALIAMAVMASTWGLVNTITNTFQFDKNNTQPTPPQLK